MDVAVAPARVRRGKKRRKHPFGRCRGRDPRFIPPVVMMMYLWVSSTCVPEKRFHPGQARGRKKKEKERKEYLRGRFVGGFAAWQSFEVRKFADDPLHSGVSTQRQFPKLQAVKNCSANWFKVKGRGISQRGQRAT